MRSTRLSGVLLLLLVISGLSGLSQPDSAPSIVYYNGQIVTMEEEFPLVSAIAIGDQHILAVGNDAEILDLAGPNTLRIDLGGRAIMPGFVDAHTHLFNDAGFWNSNIVEIQDLAARNGITTLANMYSTPEFVEEMQALEASGGLRIRTSLYMSYTTNCGDVLGDWYKNYRLNRSAESMLRILGVKIFADGGSCGRPAISFEYNDTGGHGDLFHTQEFLNESVREIHNAGYQVAIHAQGDLAVEQALNAIELALDGQPNIQRHRIEHNAYVRNDQLPRYSEIGIMPVIFGAYATCGGLLSGRYAEVFGADQLYWLENWRRFLDANPNLTIAWHGDDPGVPPVSPILELYGYVTRNELDENGDVCEAPDWLKEHAITVREALQLMTLGSAYALFMEDAVGSLKPGKFADLIILSENPLDVGVEAIKDIELLMTMIGGRVEYCEPGFDSLCQEHGQHSVNIALNQPTSASMQGTANASELAVDGDEDTWWSAEDFPTQWLEIELPEPITLSKLRLLISQFPAGHTVHNIWGRSALSGAEVLLHQFNGMTEDLEWLEFEPAIPIENVQYVRIETTQSPSWVSWREVEIYADQ